MGGVGASPEADNLVAALLAGPGRGRAAAARTILQLGASSNRLYHATGGYIENRPDVIRGLVRMLGERHTTARTAAATLLVAFCWECSQMSEDGVITMVQADEGTEPALAAALAAAEPVVRRAAVHLLRHPMAARHGEALAAALGDVDEHVRREAIRAVFEARHPDAAALVAARLEDTSALVRHEAAFRLGQTATVDTLPALEAALDDPEEHVAGSAAAALGTLGDPRAFEALRRASERGNTRALLAIGRLSDPRALDVLLAALAAPDPDGNRRAAAAAGLMHLSSPAAVDRLVALTEDPGEPDAVRGQAARALACTDDDRARAFLDRALGRQNELGRVVADGLCVMGGPWAEKANCFIREDDD